MRLLVRAAVPVEAPADVVFGYVTDWPRQREWIPLTYVRLQPGPHGDDPARHVGGGSVPGPASGRSASGTRSR